MGLEAEGYSMAGLMSSIGSESLFNDLSKINVPTLIAHGIHDKICPFKFTESLKKGIKNSTLIPFEYSGHALFWEERDKFNDELIKFIK
ncbi:AB hydrolase superfamily protein YdjP [compost metagenome]